MPEPRPSRVSDGFLTADPPADPGWDDPDGPAYRQLIGTGEADRLAFLRLLARCGYGRGLAEPLWAEIRSRKAGIRLLPAPDLAGGHEFVSNDACPIRQPVGRLRVEWVTSPRLAGRLDLRITNPFAATAAPTPPDDRRRWTVPQDPSGSSSFL